MKGQKTLYVIITVLCCLLTGAVSLWVEAGQDGDTFARKDALDAVSQNIAKLEAQNREDHREINQTLRQILQELGRIQGKTAAD